MSRLKVQLNGSSIAATASLADRYNLTIDSADDVEVIFSGSEDWASIASTLVSENSVATAEVIE